MCESSITRRSSMTHKSYGKEMRQPIHEKTAVAYLNMAAYYTYSFIIFYYINLYKGRKLRYIIT
jgi:hypothetical protein